MVGVTFIVSKCGWEEAGTARPGGAGRTGSWEVAGCGVGGGRSHGLNLFGAIRSTSLKDRDFCSSPSLTRYEVHG